MNESRSDKFRTWIVCASYALLNALGDERTDPLDVENSAGVPFGLASYGAEYRCARMLTPFTTFWDGAPFVEKIMGIRIEKLSFSNKRDVLIYLKRSSPSRAVLGPISMASLSYLPLCTQYHSADHYIALETDVSGGYLLTDSEGAPGLKVSEDDLYQFLNISEIPEAKGRFHMGIVSLAGKALPRKERTLEIFRLAGLNYRNAERSGQGGKAFFKCLRVMNELPPSHWIGPIMYDLNYLIQRKLMFLKADRNRLILTPECANHITAQIRILAQLRQALSARRFPDVFNLMPAVAEAESMIALKWKEWIAL